MNIPCEKCITFVMCKSRVRHYESNYIRTIAMLESCSIFGDYYRSHYGSLFFSEDLYKYKTELNSFFIQMKEIMK